MKTAIAVWLAGVALGIGTLVAVRSDPSASLTGASTLGAVALLGAGWTLITVGVVVGRRIPTRKWAPLLVGAGVAWFLTEWNNPGVGSPLVFTVGLIFYAACPTVVAHAALAYPSGRLASGAERVTVGVAYFGSVVVLGLAPALVFDPAAQGCGACASNLVSITNDPDLFDAFDKAGTRLAVAWSVALALLAAWRVVRSTPAARRLKAAILLPAIVYLALVAVAYAHQLGPTTFNDTFERRVWLLEAAALTMLGAAVAAVAMRAHRTRTAIARMVVDLAGASAPGGLRDSLARRLDDPDLQIIYPTGDGSRTLDARPPGKATTVLLRDGAPVALVVHRSDLLGDGRIVEDVVSAASVAFENERLVAEAQARLDELRRSQARLVAAADHEREQLERDLHDGAQQRLVGLGLAMRVTRARQGAAAATIDAAERELGHAVDDLRELASGLHPAVLTHFGLAAATRALAERATDPVRILAVPSARLPMAVERAAYQLLVEAARSGPVTATLSHDAAGLVLDIETTGWPPHLDDVADRVGALDGTLATTAGPTGDVRIRAVIPCA